MPLIGNSQFDRLFEPFVGKRVMFVPLEGNVGDLLNHLSTRLMFDRYGIEYSTVEPSEVTRERAEGVDELVISGGGNMGGDYYPGPHGTRQTLLGFGVPITVFPQSFIQNKEDLSPYKRIYVRERASQELNPGLTLAPDLALGYLGPVPRTRTACETGVFLRTDSEQRFAGHTLSLGDPARLSRDVEALFELACRFEHIVTDRLHFGIAALLAGRRVTLLPNSYFKNRSFYETWLRGLCEWKDHPEGIEYDKTGVQNELRGFLADTSSAGRWRAP